MKIIDFFKTKTAPDILYCKEYSDYDLIDKGPRRHEDLLNVLQKGCTILEDLGQEYWVGRGSLLGFHRDNSFLPNDIDIDIEIIGDENIYKIIKNLPFEPLFFSLNNGHYQQCAFIDRETNIIFDIWFYYRKEDKLYNRNYFGYFWLPEEKINNLQIFNFEKIQFPIPDPKWYCNFWYGDNWRIPKKYGKDWSIDYRKDCKGFIYNGAIDIVDNRYY